jgi:hypothetical protein
VKLSVSDRFWKNTKKEGDCIVWTKSKIKNGYGRFALHQSSVLAHRFSAYLNGMIDDYRWSKSWNSNDFVCHKCDNPSCVNPDHLFVGTHQDNMDDRSSKGRNKALSGFSHPNCKTDRESFKRIKELSANGFFPSQIAKIVGLPILRVERIVYNITFKGESL